MLPIGILIAGLASASVVAYRKKQRRAKYKNAKAISSEESLFTEFSDIREQQIQEITSKEASEGQLEQSEVDKETNHHFPFAIAGLSLATAGAFSPVFGLLSIPVSIYASLPIFKAAYYHVIEERKFRVAVLDAIAITSGLVTGYYFVTALAATVYYSAAKLLKRTRNNTQKSLINVFSGQPSTVWLVKDQTEIEIPLSELHSKDIIVVHAGEIIPVDGTIIEGMGTIDQHALTGEAQPDEKVVNDKVMASTVVLMGKIYIEVEKTGTETIAAQIGDILNDTTEFELSLQTQGEKMADKTVMPTLATSALGLMTLGAYSSVVILSANFSEVIRITTPIGMLNFLNLASKNDILIKDGRSLELLNSIDTVVFDKTGTLTQEQPHLGDIVTEGDIDADELLSYAAAAEHKQKHPVAKAIIEAAEQRQLEIAEIDESQYEMGYGIKVTVGDKLIRVGSIRFMQMENISIPGSQILAQQASHDLGYSTVFVAIDDDLGGMLELRPTIRPEAKQVIAKLKQRGLSIYIISGDHEHPTRQLAEDLGVDHYLADTLPQDKAKKIEELQAQGKSVCFIGDGINDSIALKKANVSISLRGASTAATDTAQVILMQQSLEKIEDFFNLAKSFEKNQHVGLATTFIPGVICIGGVFFLHFSLVNALMLYNISAIAGIGNALRPLLGGKPKKTPPQIEEGKADTKL